MHTVGHPLTVAFGFEPPDHEPEIEHPTSASPLVLAASAAYDAVMAAGLRAALDAHQGDRCAAAESVHMLPRVFARACKRYGIATTPGKAGRKPRAR